MIHFEFAYGFPINCYCVGVKIYRIRGILVKTIWIIWSYTSFEAEFHAYSEWEVKIKFLPTHLRENPIWKNLRGRGKKGDCFEFAAKCWFELYPYVMKLQIITSRKADVIKIENAS